MRDKLEALGQQRLDATSGVTNEEF
jgi:hypothetical protein